MASDRERAWQYHEAADQLLSGRMQSFLIAQAFLVVGYAQLLTASSFCSRVDLMSALCAVSGLAFLLTLIMRNLVSQLSKGLRELKDEYLLPEDGGDPVYQKYLGAIVKKNGRVYSSSDLPRGLTGLLPGTFFLFWIGAGGYALLLLVDEGVREAVCGPM